MKYKQVLAALLAPCTSASVELKVTIFVSDVCQAMSSPVSSCFSANLPCTQHRSIATALIAAGSTKAFGQTIPAGIDTVLDISTSFLSKPLVLTGPLPLIMPLNFQQLRQLLPSAKTSHTFQNRATATALTDPDHNLLRRISSNYTRRPRLPRLAIDKTTSGSVA